jgi:hypothetical protein
MMKKKSELKEKLNFEKYEEELIETISNGGEKFLKDYKVMIEDEYYHRVLTELKNGKEHTLMDKNGELGLPLLLKDGEIYEPHPKGYYRWVIPQSELGWDLDKIRFYNSTMERFVNYGKMMGWNDKLIMERYYDNMLELHKPLQIKMKDGNTSEVRVLKLKVGRNEKCLCGSGLKYKKCCLINNDIGWS